MRCIGIAACAALLLLSANGISQAELLVGFEMEQASSPLLDSVAGVQAVQNGTGNLYHQAGVPAGTYGAITLSNGTGYSVGESNNSSQWDISAADSQLINLSNNFTLMGWLYLPNQPTTPNSMYNYATIVGRASSWAARGFFLSVRNTSNKGVNFTKNGVGEWYSGAEIPWDHQWHHIAVTQSSTDGIKMYLDGVLANSFDTALAKQNVNPLLATEAYCIGNGNNFGQGATAGQQIDGFRVYNEVLNVDQIAVAAKDSAVPEPSTVAILISGMAGLLCYAWKRSRQRA